MQNRSVSVRVVGRGSGEALIVEELGRFLQLTYWRYVLFVHHVRLSMIVSWYL